METGRTDEEDFGMAAIKYRRKKHKSYDRMVFSVVSHLALFVLAAICLLPFWLVISGSLSEQQSIRLNGYQLIPEQVSLEAYRMLFRIPEELIRVWSDNSGDGSRNGTWIIGDQYGILCTGE